EFGFFYHLVRHPFGKRHRARDMISRSSVFLPGFIKLSRRKMPSRAHQRRPQPAMHERQLVVHNPADDYVRRVTGCTKDSEHVTAAWVRPSASFDARANDGF